MIDENFYKSKVSEFDSSDCAYPYLIYAITNIDLENPTGIIPVSLPSVIAVSEKGLSLYLFDLGVNKTSIIQDKITIPYNLTKSIEVRSLFKLTYPFNFYELIISFDDKGVLNKLSVEVPKKMRGFKKQKENVEGLLELFGKNFSWIYNKTLSNIVNK